MKPSSVRDHALACVGMLAVLACAQEPDDPRLTDEGQAGLRKSLGGTNGDFDYCNNSICLAGEGDCDRDSECASGLVCTANVGAQFGLPENWDFCLAPTCTNGVTDGDETARDCGGSCGPCVCGGTLGSSTFCTSACPCSTGQGDCDSSSQCMTGLVCGTNNGPKFGFSATIDACVPSHCTNRIRDMNEIGVDCGGADCGNCVVECQNGIVDPGEACDDGNRRNGDACETNCTLPTCGNGIRDVGEACDDGNSTNGDACDNNCTFPACGNGIVDPNEECDGGPLTLLVGSFEDNAVRRFDGTTGAFIDVLVSSGSGGLSSPQTLAIGPDNNLYVSSWATGSVLRYNLITGAFIDAFVPSGSGGLANPDQLAFGPDGHLYVSDRFASAIRRYDGTTGASLGVFVLDPALGGFVGFTFGPDGNIYAGEFNGFHDVRRYDGTTGALIGVFASGDHQVSDSGIIFGPDGNLYVSGLNSSSVARYNGTSGAFINLFVAPGSGGLSGADYSTFGPDGNFYICSQGTAGVLRYDGATGAFIDTFASLGAMHTPKGLVFSNVNGNGCASDCTLLP